MELIVTDLTRFKRQDILCMAALTFDGKRCIRPMKTAPPGYLSFDACEKHAVLPGTVLSGEFTPSPSAVAPHVEDCYFTNLRVLRMAKASEFYNVLSSSAYASIETAFGVAVDGKVVSERPTISIITLRVSPSNFRIVRDKFDTEKIKAHVTDSSGMELSFLSVTDFGLADFIGKSSSNRITVENFNSLIRNQEELFLRIGLSRKYNSPNGKNGYWIQVNGVYTFPN